MWFCNIVHWFKLCSSVQIPKDQWWTSTEQTEQKTIVTVRWEKCFTDSRGDPNWCVGWIMHLAQSFQFCKFAKWQWSKLSLKGMVLRGRLKWLRECIPEGERGHFCLLSGSVMTCFTFTHPSVSLSSYPGNTNRLDKFSVETAATA